MSGFIPLWLQEGATVLAGGPWDEVDLDGAGLGIGGVAPGDESPGEAAARVVSDLALNRSEWVQAGRQDGRWGQARLCRVLPERVLHVVGDSAMAAGLRELLAAGSVPGWHLNPVPVGRTPVHELAGPLHSMSGSVRYYNLLARFGFVTIEEVAVTPDACLLTIHQAGPRMVTAIRAVLGELGYELPKVAHPAVRGVVAERRALLRARLTGEQQVRYGEFAELLARSSMPVRALEKIADSLNAEAVPSADPLVCLLLSTAGEDELGEYYQSSHALPEDVTKL